MQQAKYTTECSGHFGLAAEYYCHFTSPIRRYPDLQIHRIIKESLHNRLNESRREHYGALLPDVAAKCSKLERRADDAEREVEKLKKVQYMERHIGEEYEGMISGVTGWGMYVELPNTVEGLVHVSIGRLLCVLREHLRTDRRAHQPAFSPGGKGPYPGGGCRYPHEND